MANKAIGQLPEASAVQSTDLFLLEQTGVAKKLTGQTLTNELAAALDGHGGIANAVYTEPVYPSLDGTLVLTFADGTNTSIALKNGRGISNTYITNSGVARDGMRHRITFNYNNGTSLYFDIYDGSKGSKGDTGPQGAKGDSFTYEDFTPEQLAALTGPQGAQGNPAYVWIRWASRQPQADSDLSVIPNAWMGVYGGASATAPTSYTAYQWYEVKGAKGDDGEPITAVTRTSGDGSPGTDDTYTVYVNSTAVGTFIVHNGSDGIGTVNSINGIGVSSGTNNVVLTAADVGAAAVPLHLQATATSLPLTINNSAITTTMRVVECNFGTPSAITSNVAWTTSNGSIVLSGTMSGSTTVELVLIETI